MSGEIAQSAAMVALLRLDMVPDRRLAPNASGTKTGWTKGPMISTQRESARMLANQCRYESLETFLGPVTVDIEIAWGKSLKAGPKRARIEQVRRLDWDSATIIVKPICDGALVDTGIIGDDRQIVSGVVRQTVDPDGRGFTVIQVWEAMT